MKRWLFHIVAALALVGLDQGAKAYVHTLPYLGTSSYAYPYGGIALFEGFFGIDFSINHVGNRGAAWGMFADFGEALLVVRLLLVGALLYYLLRKSKPYERLPLFLALGGALSNILDLFTYGYVIDFLHFSFHSRHFPLFNFADSAICLSVVLLLAQSFFRRPRAPIPS